VTFTVRERGLRGFDHTFHVGVLTLARCLSCSEGSRVPGKLPAAMVLLGWWARATGGVGGGGNNAQARHPTEREGEWTGWAHTS
jgi:hypothetical protein